MSNTCRSDNAINTQHTQYTVSQKQTHIKSLQIHYFNVTANESNFSHLHFILFQKD